MQGNNSPTPKSPTGQEEVTQQTLEQDQAAVTAVATEMLANTEAAQAAQGELKRRSQSREESTAENYAEQAAAATTELEMLQAQLLALSNRSQSRATARSQSRATSQATSEGGGSPDAKQPDEKNESALAEQVKTLQEIVEQQNKMLKEEKQRHEEEKATEAKRDEDREKQRQEQIAAQMAELKAMLTQAQQAGLNVTGATREQVAGQQPTHTGNVQQQKGQQKECNIL